MIFENPVLTNAAVRKRMNVNTQGALNLIRCIEARDWLEQVGTAYRCGARTRLRARGRGPALSPTLGCCRYRSR